MQLSKLKNGYIVVDAGKSGEYNYIKPSDSAAAGVYYDGQLYTTGETKVYVRGAINKGQVVRSRSDGDPGLEGQAIALTSDYSGGYVQIGTALESGRNKLIRVSLDNRQAQFFSQVITWDDIRITPGNFDRPGVDDPTYRIYYPNGGGLGVYLPFFDKDDFVSFTIQMPHGYKQGSDIHVHLHWTPGVNGVAESGHYVGWKFDYTWANIGSNFPDMQTIDLSDVCDGVNHKHQMTSDIAIPGRGKRISSMLLCNLRRTDTGADDTWAGTAASSPIITELDIHYMSDSQGSRQRSSK